MSTSKSLLTLPRLTPAQVVIGLPVIHVVVVCLFIASYSLGFGAYVSTFASLDMIFSTSIRDIALIYLSGLVVPGIFVASRYVAGVPNRYYVISKIEDPSLKAIEVDRHAKYQKITKRIAWAMGILLTSVALYFRFYQGNDISPLGLFMSWQLLVMIHTTQFLNKVTSDDFTHEALFLMALLAMTTIALGADRGNGDRKKTFTEASASHVVCEDHAILRGFGDLYLAVNRQDIKVLVNEDCEQKFSVPSSAGVGATSSPTTNTVQ